MNQLGEHRKNDAVVLADFLMRLHRKVEKIIEVEEEVVGDLDIALEEIDRMRELERIESYLTEKRREQQRVMEETIK